MSQPSFPELAQRFVRRVTAADFQRERAADDERAELAAAAAAVEPPLAQDYAAWRRAGLWLAAVLLSLAGVLSVIDYQSFGSALAEQALTSQGAEVTEAHLEQALKNVENAVGAGNLELLDNLQMTILGSKLVVALFAVLAALRWVRVRESRRMSLLAFVVALGVPLVLAAIPWTRFMDLEEPARGLGLGQAAQIKAMLGLVLASAFAAMLIPKLFSVFPGILRSAMTLKTLLPESAIPGWAVIAFAPIYAVFLMILLSVINQMQASTVLTLGVGALVAAPVLYVVHAKDVVRGHSADEVTELIRKVRSKVLLCNGFGIILLVIYLFDLESVPVLTKLHMLIEGFGSVVLTMVVFSDMALPLLGLEFRQSRELQGSSLAESLQARLGELDAAGLIDVRAAFRLRQARDEGAA
ncbi:MAG: hypothetical protein KDE27_18255 [Planctomycetes bacterium]|nr:hypothetical protein [Planctomycetota bacterium]